MIYVALRFDDPGPASDHGLETGITSRLQRYRAPATFAVIPFLHRQGETFPLQAAQVPHLIQAEASGHIEIAQHGFSHEKRVASDGTVGEMVGLAAEAQKERIIRGRACLQAVFGATPSGFVPPWNGYDRKTLACVRDAGFAYLSAGWEGPLCRSLSVIPRTCNVADVRATVEKIRKCRVSASVIGVMHHYDFREHSSDPRVTWSLDDFEALLAWLVMQKDVELHTLASLNRLCSPWGWLTSFVMYRAAQRLHWRVRKNLPPDCLPAPPHWRFITSRSGA